MINQKEIGIIGSGISGLGAAKLAIRNNLNFFMSDYSEISNDIKELLNKNNIEFEENGHNWERLSGCDEIILSPGISSKKILLKIPNYDSKNIISEIEFASRYTNAKIIAITGTNGKTTTSYLIYHILKSSGLNVGLAGNLGISFSETICLRKYDYYVLEVSSFQLENIKKFKPFISIILNVSNDHLDRYNYSIKEYTRAKFNISSNQDSNDYLIINTRCKHSSQFLSQNKITSQLIHIGLDKNDGKNKIFKEKNTIKSTINNKNVMFNLNEFSLRGDHNIQNSMAAICVSQILNISNDSIKESLKTFQNVPHRLEHFLTIQKVKYVNDSKGTNVNAAYYALESIKGSVIWIAGGVDKGNDYKDLIPLVNQKVKAIICLGIDNSKLIEFFSPHCETIISTDNIKDAVRNSYKLSEKNDTVLLSPACASFDLFENFEDRGNKFKEEVRKL